MGNRLQVVEDTEEDYNVYYGDGDSMRKGNSKRGIVRKQPDSKSVANVSKIMKYHCVTGVILVMTIVLCSAVEVVLIKIPFGLQMAKEAHLTTHSFNVACDIGSGWIDGNHVQLGCLLFGKEEMNWTQAETFCSKKNSRLVEIHDTKQKFFIMNYIKIFNAISNAQISWWAGATVNGNQDWLWAQSRLPVQDFVWASGHPVVNRSQALCLYNNPSYDLNAYECRIKVPLKPICQVQ